MTPCVWFRFMQLVLTALWLQASTSAIERLYEGVDAP
jgi:hypothetical protein